jgi:hypothetical protein
MKPRKNTILIMLLGLLLVAFATGIAQNPSQTDQKTKTEACCSMDSCCCCNGDSCPMKEEGAANADAKHSCCSGDSCKMKTKADMKNHSDDHECCSCCGDSCDMKMKGDANMKHDGNMKHDATMKHDSKSHKGDCCNIKNKDKSKTKQKSA